MTEQRSHQELVQDYIDRKGVVCLYCQSSQLDGEQVDIDSGRAYQEITCLDCNATWTDVYQLCDVIRPGKGESHVPDGIAAIDTDHGRFVRRKESEPDFDQEYPFHCASCRTTAWWSMNNAIEAGTPICEGCGEDMAGGALE